MMDLQMMPMAFGRPGTTEILVILVVLVVLFGPNLLPKLGKTFGDTIRGFRDGLNSGSEEKDDEEK